MNSACGDLNGDGLEEKNRGGEAVSQRVLVIDDEAEIRVDPYFHTGYRPPQMLNVVNSEFPVLPVLIITGFGVESLEATALAEFKRKEAKYHGD